jgi:hypothetical protein
MQKFTLCSFLPPLTRANMRVKFLTVSKLPLAGSFDGLHFQKKLLSAVPAISSAGSRAGNSV